MTRAESVPSPAPAQIVDAHVHVSCADRNRFPPHPTGVGSAWWDEPSSSSRTGQSDAVFEGARRLGIDHVVVVQAVGAYGYDCSCARHAATSSNGFASLVTAPDMSTLAGIDRDEATTGWRLFGVADGAPWLDDGRADTVWAEAAAQGIVLVPTIFSDRLGSLRRVVERHPDVALALDHCAFADMAGPAGVDALFGIADLTSVRLKVSTHVLAAWDREDVLDPMFARLIDAFGAHRLCWGSDHPQHHGSYATKVALASRAARHLDQQQRHQFFAGTAAALGWPATA